jgi:hypothetical protein
MKHESPELASSLAELTPEAARLLDLKQQLNRVSFTIDAAEAANHSAIGGPLPSAEDYAEQEKLIAQIAHLETDGKLNDLTAIHSRTTADINTLFARRTLEQQIADTEAQLRQHSTYISNTEDAQYSIEGGPTPSKEDYAQLERLEAKLAELQSELAAR